MATLAARSGGLLTLDQLQAIGLTSDAVANRVARGLLHRMHPGVFAFGRKPDLAMRLRAALMTSGPQSFLSHRTAAAAWGLRAHDASAIHVTVPQSHPPRRKGLRLHRTRDELTTADVVTRNGLRVSTVARLLVELAPQEPLTELSRLITQGIRKRVLNVDAVNAVIDRHPRRPGMADLRRAFDYYRPRPNRKSQLERAFDELIEGSGIPEPQRNVVVDGWELDCYWPEHGLAVELDGRSFHEAARDFEKDRYKDGKLLLIGIRVLRITAFRMASEPWEVLRDLRRLTGLQCAITLSTTAAPKQATAPTLRR